jgi:hypothetical protein
VCDDPLMHFAVQWGGSPEDLTVTTSGVAEVEDLDAMMREVISAPEWREGMKILLDHTQTDWSALGAGDLDRRAALVEEIADRIGRQQVAFVVKGRLNQEIGKMLGARMSEIEFVGKAFVSLDDARAWLREEPDLDTADAKPS